MESLQAVYQGQCVKRQADVLPDVTEGVCSDKSVSDWSAVPRRH